MSGFFAFIGVHKVAAVVASVAVVVGGAQLGGSDERQATVTRVVDGDTVDVAYDGDTHRIRLLNIDTPETVDPSKPVECMGAEATDFLRRLLPRGTSVTLGYDDERTDRYGRELAGVFLDDRLVNAEIARAGLGAAIIVGGNDRYYQPVKRAQDEAAGAGRGLFGTEVACTLPAQIAAVESSAEKVSAAAAPAEEAGLAELGEEIGLIAGRLGVLRSVMQGDAAIFPLLPFSDDNNRRVLTERLGAIDAKITASRELISAARAGIEQRRLAEQAAREAAEQAAREAAEQIAREAAREADERAALEAAETARKAAAKAARDAAAAEEAQRARDAARRSSSSSGASSSGGSTGTGGYDGYTGCRAYGSGGTSIDEKGRRYTKISC